MIDFKSVLYIMLGISTLIGGITTFLVMQNTQNLEIKHMKEQQEKQDSKISDQTKYQIQTEKNIIEIKGNLSNLDDKMDMVVIMMKELKAQGCGRCLDKT